MALAGFATIALLHAAMAASQPRTVWDGVYSEAQAKRAEPLYMEKCAKCHAAEMTGKDGPPIVGAEFSGNWNDLSVNDLFEKIRIGMPDDAKNTLTRNEVADLIALMLQRAGMPAGTAELPIETAALKDIKYVGVKPQK
jgi:cytochrome c